MLKIKCSLHGLFYFIFLLLIYGYYTLSNTNILYNIQNVCNLLMVGAMLMFSVLCIQQKFKVKEFIIILVLLSVAYLTVLGSGNAAFLILTIVMIGSIGSEPNKALKIVLFFKIVYFVMVLTFFALGLARDNIKYRGDAIRHSLGFGHPNGLGLQYFFLVLLFIACYGIEKKKKSSMGYSFRYS